MPQFQVLPAAPSFGSQLGQALGGGLSQGIGTSINQYFARKQNEKQLAGLAPIFEQMGLPQEGIAQLIGSGLDPASVATLAGQLGQQQASFAKEERKSQEKREEKAAPYKSALDTLKRQRQLLATGKLGPKAGGFGQSPKAYQAMSKSGQKVRSEYERLGKSLIQMSTNIPIRNRQEFETLAHDLFDPTLNESQIEGSLDAMERIIKNSLKQYGSQEMAPSQTEESGDFVLMKDPQGVVKRIPRSQAMAAQKAGGKLVQ